MGFQVTDDEVLYLYTYYSLDEKHDEVSKIVYHVFKKGWGVDRYLPDICDDLFEAVEDYMAENEMEDLEVAVTVMPSHLKGTYGESLLKMAHRLAEEFGYWDASELIERTADKTKSTEGGIRAVGAHLLTLGLSPDFDEIDYSVDVYMILDDITTSGSSLEAAKQVLVRNGVKEGDIIKIAVAKTMHDDLKTRN